jgi:hypothetical protein
MANISIDIEQVVREVMAELGLAPKPRADSPEKASGDASGNASGETASGNSAEAKTSGPVKARSFSPGELAIASRVVTLAELDGKLGNGVRRVLVPLRAIVTPSVRDELRRKNVELVYDQVKTDGDKRPAGTALAVVVHGGQTDAEVLTKALAGDGIPVESQVLDCVIAAADRLAERLAGGGVLAVLLTKHTAAAACLANRLPGVRAVLGVDPAAVADDAAAVGANLLIVDPARNGLFRARQIIGQFYRQGPQNCPKVFQERLK